MATLDHLKHRLPRIALLAIYIDKYDFAFEGYREQGRALLQRIGAALSEQIETVLIELGSSAAECKAAVGAAEKAGADLLVVVSHGYVNSLIAADALCETSLPLVFFNTQDVEVMTPAFNFINMKDNHGMQGIQDVAAVMVRRGRHFGIVTGTVQHDAVRAALLDHATVARTRNVLRGRRIGAFGPVMEGMGDAEVERSYLAEQLGLEAIDLAYADLAALAKGATPAAVEAAVAADRERFALADDVTLADHERSARLYLGLRAIAERERLAGMTFSFDGIAGQPGIETIPFLGITRLMGEGMSYGGEGDLFTTATGTIAWELCGDFSFTEMYTMDWINNQILHTHMAELSPAFARRDRKPRLLRRQFTLATCEPFCSLTFSVEPGPITLVANTILPDGRLHFIALETDVLDYPPLEGFDIPNFMIGYRRPISEIVDEYSLLGGPHHLNMVFGRQAKRYKLFCDLMGFKYSQIANG